MKLKRPTPPPTSDVRASVPASSHASPEGPRFSRGRRLIVRVLAILALVMFNFMLVFVLSDAAGGGGTEAELVPPGSPEARIGAEHPEEAVHLVGTAAALVIGVTGLAGLVVGPQQAGAATQAGLAAMAWLIAAAIMGDPDNQGGQAGTVDLAFVVLALPSLIAALIAAPWRTWRNGGLVRVRFLLMALLGAPWAWYGFHSALMQRNTWPPMADPHHQAHWFAMSLVAFAIVLIGAGGALPGGGWRIATATSGLAAIGLGAVSLVAPDAASALHPAWAAAGALWGLTMLFLTWRGASHRSAEVPERS